MIVVAEIAIPCPVRPRTKPDDEERELAERRAQDRRHAGAGEQQGDPGLLGEPPGDRRGDDGREPVAHGGHDDHQGEVAESRVPVAGRVEVVPVQQDRHEERDPVQDAVPADRPDGGRRAPAAGEVGHSLGETVDAPPAVPATAVPVRGPPRGPVPAGRAAWWPPSARPAGSTLPPTSTITAALPWPPPSSRRRPTRDDARDRRHDAADRRGHGVRHHELVVGHDVRQGRGQRGQEEPVDAERGQRAHVQRHTELRRTATSSAVTATSPARTSADTSRIWRRDQRSMKTPANGPMSE